MRWCRICLQEGQVEGIVRGLISMSLEGEVLRALAVLMGQAGPVGQSNAPASFNFSEIIRHEGLISEVNEHPLRVLLCQMSLFSLITAAAGTLIAVFLPEASVNNASNGVYVLGLVGILFIETIYQWMLRAGTLAGERGVIAIAEGNYPDVPLDGLREYLRNDRNGFESRLRRLFEPVEKVGLLTLALLVHLFAQESSDFALARVASEQWAMTLFLAFAGLLWQLRNTDNITRLSAEMRVEGPLAKLGERFYVFGLPVMTVASILVLGFAFWPWGFTSVAPLGLAFWYTRKSLGNPQVNLAHNGVRY